MHHVGCQLKRVFHEATASLPDDICDLISASLTMAHNNLLDDDWVFSSCVFFDEQHATIKIELCKASDEEVVIPIYVSASDVPPGGSSWCRSRTRSACP